MYNFKLNFPFFFLGSPYISAHWNKKKSLKKNK